MGKQFGAAVERGEITGAESGGYTVKSCDRDGIESPPITPIDNESYTKGDKVYFFLFPDGTGKILCRL